MNTKQMKQSVKSKPPYLVWVSAVNPATTLDAATWLETTKHLRTLGWQVTLLCEGTRGERCVRRILVYCLPRPQLYFLGQALYHLNIVLWLLARWRTIDVLLFQHTSGLWLLPLRLLRSLTRQRRPLLVMDTRDIDDSHAGKLKVALRQRIHAWVFGLANRLADGQTAITRRMATLLGIPPAHLWGVWPSGVNPGDFAPAQGERQWPVANEPVHLIYIGILIPKRNLLPLCEAVVQANQGGARFCFALYGDGVARPALEAVAAQSNGAIRVLPPVPHQAVPQLLAKAQVGVTALPAHHNPKYEASSPIKLFEYLAAGLPILATRNACYTDVVGDGAYAFWAEEATVPALVSTLNQVWRKRHTLAGLGAEAAAAAQSWSWQAAAQKLSNALQQGLAQ